MVERLLARNQGRSDDNIDTIKKRFTVCTHSVTLFIETKVFMNQTMAVVNHYSSMDKVRRVEATKDPETVYEQVKAFFAAFTAKSPQSVS